MKRSLRGTQSTFPELSKWLVVRLPAAMRHKDTGSALGQEDPVEEAAAIMCAGESHGQRRPW